MLRSLTSESAEYEVTDYVGCVGNNIANVNFTGFKKSAVTFRICYTRPVEELPPSG